MGDTSLHTLHTIALIKILGVCFLVGIFFVLRYTTRKAWWIAFLTGLTASTWFLLLSRGLQKMWYGNVGDEIFQLAFLTQVMRAHPFHDFYYHGLPVFYPPLYFWITGFLGTLFTSNAVGAAKLGITLTLFIWFVGVFIWCAIYSKYISFREERVSALQIPWYWFGVPAIVLCLLRTEDILFKPYEALSALGVTILIGCIAQSLQAKTWTIKHYLFFGISGGLLFLTYYFWWFITIPSLFALAFFSVEKKKNICRIIGIGAVMFLIASPYLIPLFLSYRFGMENWQGAYLIPDDFFTFLPFSTVSIKTVGVVVGIIGLYLYRKNATVQGAGYIVLCGYLYQSINVVLFVLGHKSAIPSKPFIFLVTAALGSVAAYTLVELWQTYATKLSKEWRRGIIGILIIFSIPLWPMTAFMDSKETLERLDVNTKTPAASILARDITRTVPDAAERTWLTSGIPEINVYIPMHYFVAFNPHFSHHAAKYSERFAVIKRLTTLDEQAFVQEVSNLPIDALLLYTEASTSTYPLFFWADNYPNGGKELQLDIPKTHIEALHWKKVFEGREWVIYVK